ncbi:hypothetical protein BDF19DRAFT_480045 [Syncephalis fuscata]|nr:hypothetical protein BDF19DRAFT_480045 [Syncephalis fuscata]
MTFSSASLAVLAIIAAFAMESMAAPNSSADVRCKLPNDPLIVPITPNAMNKGWAMSANQECKPGDYCPYACAPGYFSRQWNPDSAIHHNTMDGGLLCQKDGLLAKPFPNEPYCVRGLDNTNIVNKLGESVSACQTVYPGNEEMLIPTVVASNQQSSINVPSRDYWQGTSAQYYVNPSGTNNNQCVWGDASKPIGNWAPFVFGAGEGMEDVTFLSVRYNPDYERAGQSTAKAYSVRIECKDPSKCNGLPCKCENGRCSKDNGCTVAVRTGGQASFVLYGEDTINYTPSLQDSNAPIIPVDEVVTPQMLQIANDCP